MWSLLCNAQTWLNAYIILKRFNCRYLYSLHIRVLDRWNFDIFFDIFTMRSSDIYSFQKSRQILAYFSQWQINSSVIFKIINGIFSNKFFNHTTPLADQSVHGYIFFGFIINIRPYFIVCRYLWKKQLPTAPFLKFRPCIRVCQNCIVQEAIFLSCLFW